MKQRNSLVLTIGILVLVVGLHGPLHAETEVALNEAEMVEALSQQHAFRMAAAKDPFKPLVVKPVVILPPPPVSPVDNRNSGKTRIAPPVKPVEIRVSGICGNDSGRLALVWYQNRPLCVSQGQSAHTDFKVIDIQPRQVVVYCNKTQSRRSFPLERK